MSGGRSTILISTTSGWISVAYCADILGSQKMNPPDFLDPLASLDVGL